MNYFNFHHHHLGEYGIYNKPLPKVSSTSPYSVGLHPKEISDDWENDFQSVVEQSKDPHCVAIGECGLDQLSNSSIEQQKIVFEQHILLANEIDKPVIIHCVRFYHELNHFSKLAKTPLIVHGFNKKGTIATTLVEQGFYLSFGKAVLHRVYLQELIRNLSINQFFLETDDDEFDIKELYQKVSTIKGISIEKVVDTMELNKQNILYG